MANKSILSRLVGHSWELDVGVVPRIISVVKTHFEPGRYSENKPSAKWLLDYTLTPFGRYRVRHPGSSWKERNAFEAHLYPPGGSKWEDTTPVRLPHTESIFITFMGGEHTGLADMVKDHGYAHFKDPFRRLLPLLERILRDGLELDDNGYWDAQAALYEIVALLHRCDYLGDEYYAVPEEHEISSPFTDFVRDVRLYLRDHLIDRITRNDLARHLHTSVSAMASRYRAEAGESPMNTLTRMRINLAKSLISRGYRLKTVAEHTGFCDEYHLSKVFKLQEGVSPRDYRKHIARKQLAKS